MSRFRMSLAAVAVVAIAVPAIALAANPTAGQWKGKIVDEPDTKVTFKVVDGPKRALKFRADSISVYCGSFPTGYLSSRTIVLPNLKVQNGGMTRTKRFFDDGEEIGRIIVSGTFKSSTKVKGLITYQDNYCSGEDEFNARRQG